MPLFEMVPNLSEGRDIAIIDACVAAVEGSGAQVLHRTSDPVHNRSVLTVAGSYDQVLEAGIQLAGVASKSIDLRAHRGVHPRIGALDVLPFVPLRDASMEDAVRLAREAAVAIWERYQIPSFLYANAATAEHRRNLASVRSGEFEGLDARFERPEWKPDFGTIAKHAGAGATAIGARDILIAFNVELATGDLTVAKRIARQIRERDGGLRTLKALGLRLRDDLMQVSLNITDYRATPLYRVVELIAHLAREHQVEIAGCELIGCLPYEAVAETTAYYLGLPLANGLVELLM